MMNHRYGVAITAMLLWFLSSDGFAKPLHCSMSYLIKADKNLVSHVSGTVDEGEVVPLNLAPLTYYNGSCEFSWKKKGDGHTTKLNCSRKGGKKVSAEGKYIKEACSSLIELPLVGEVPMLGLKEYIYIYMVRCFDQACVDARK